MYSSFYFDSLGAHTLLGIVIQLLFWFAMKLKNELFPMVVVEDIHFPSERSEMFSEQIPTAAEIVLNNSLRLKGCSLQ